VDVTSTITTVIVLVLFFWVTYNLPSVVVGLKELGAVKRRRERKSDHIDTPDPATTFQPKVSIIVPLKNEGNVIERLLKTLTKLSYRNKEIILMEDGSTDKSPEICRQWEEKHPTLIRYYHNDKSGGKPVAINSAARKATGEIIALYDADTIVETDILEKIVPYFKDPNVVVVQGELKTLNPDENVITRLAVINDFIVNVQQLGRDKLNLFVPLLGTNQYIRKSVLEQIGYWDSDALSEDTEISLQLARRGYKVKYVAVSAMVEAPAKLKVFIGQRMKWLRGYTQAAMKHIGFVKDPNWRTLDAQIMLLFPLMLILGLVGYVMALYGALNSGMAPSYVPSIVQILGLVMLAVNLLTSATVLVENPRNAIYIPLLYVDWILLASVSFYVHLRALLGRPQSWTKTPKSGHVTVSVSGEASQKG